MFQLLFKIFFSVITNVANIVLLPINALIHNMFPDFSSYIQQFTDGVSTIFGGALGYFSNLLPPITKNIVLLYLSILLVYYTVSISVHAILKVIHIIKAIKIW